MRRTPTIPVVLAALLLAGVAGWWLMPDTGPTPDGSLVPERPRPQPEAQLVPAPRRGDPAPGAKRGGLAVVATPPTTPPPDPPPRPRTPSLYPQRTPPPVPDDAPAAPAPPTWDASRPFHLHSGGAQAVLDALTEEVDACLARTVPDFGPGETLPVRFTVLPDPQDADAALVTGLSIPGDTESRFTGFAHCLAPVVQHTPFHRPEGGVATVAGVIER